MKKNAHVIPSFLCLIFTAAVLSSCATTTGTRVALDQSTLSQIDKMGIDVKKEGDFSVRFSRDKATNTGAVMFSFGGLLVESGVRNSTDKKIREELEPQVSDFDPQTLMSEKLLYYFQQSKVITDVVSSQNSDSQESQQLLTDTILQVNIKEWGLWLCLGSGQEEKLQVGIDVAGTIFKDKKTIWEHNEMYNDGQCFALPQLKSGEVKIKDILVRAIDTVSGKIVNEICYP